MPDHRTPILQVQALSFGYPSHPLFQEWSAVIDSGVTVLRGGDGRGKTSLLRLLAGELPAQGGDLQILDISLRQQADNYRRQIFWADPDSDAFDQMTVSAYLASLRTRYPTFDDAALAALISGLSLTAHMDKQLFMLSTGTRRKVWICAAFACGAVLTLLDMPFAGLDKASIQFVSGLLNQVAEQTARAWVIAMYEKPQDIPMAALIDLGD